MIKEGQVVELSLVLKNAQGKQLDATAKDDSFTYLHGFGQLPPGLEVALEGLKTGDTKSVTLPPAEGYGEINPKLAMKVSRDNFPKNQALNVGMRFHTEIGNDVVEFKITKIEGHDVYIDGNHDLAGETVQFDVEVKSVRAATKEELEHGHVHGPGGHHH